MVKLDQYFDCHILGFVVFSQFGRCLLVVMIMI